MPHLLLRRGICSTRNSHLSYNLFSYRRLSFLYYAFVFTLSYVSILKSTNEALSRFGCRQSMKDKMIALHMNDICDLMRYFRQNHKELLLDVHCQSGFQWIG